MLVLYCKTRNLIGLTEPGWNYVLCMRQILTHSADGRRGSALVSELHDYDESWAVVGTL
jgi:hypothetical protein